MRKPASNPTDLAKSLVKLSRPQNIVYSGLLAALVCYFFTGDFIVSALCYTFIFLLYAVSATYNNLKDMSADIINKRADNPLVYGEISRKHAKLFLITAALLLCATQLGLSQPRSLLIAIFYILLLYLYSGRPNFKSRSWLGVILLTVCYGGIPILIGFFQSESPINSRLFLGVILNTSLLFPLLLAKDYKDIKGDRATSTNTPVVIHGPQTVRLIALITSIVASIAFILISAHSTFSITTPLLMLLYVIYISYLHTRKGRVSPLYVKTGTLLLLSVSISLFQFIAS